MASPQTPPAHIVTSHQFLLLVYVAVHQMTPRYVSLLTAPAAQTAPKLAALGCLKISPRGNARITQTGRDAIDAYRIAARHPSGHP